MSGKTLFKATAFNIKAFFGFKFCNFNESYDLIDDNILK